LTQRAAVKYVSDVVSPFPGLNWIGFGMNNGPLFGRMMRKEKSLNGVVIILIGGLERKEKTNAKSSKTSLRF
jgi:hypothetical protein